MLTEKELQVIHEEIKKTLKTFTDYGENKNYDKLVEIYTDNAVLLSNKVLIEGKKNIRQFYVNLLGNLDIERIEIMSKGVFEYQGKIIEVGTNESEVKQNGNKKVMKGNYVSIWRKIGEKWLIEQDLIPPMPE